MTCVGAGQRHGTGVYLVGNQAGATHISVRLKRLADAARASQQAAEDDREARNTAIGEADAAGWPLREISRWTGMSPSHVQRIVIDQTTAHQLTPEVHVEP